MRLGHLGNCENGLTVCVDWLSFTLKDSKEPSEAFELLGYNRDDFMELPSGRYGYKSAFKHLTENVHVLYDGNDGMGVHVDVSGSSIDNVVSAYRKKKHVDTPYGDSAYETSNLDGSVFADLCSEIRVANGQFTRLDLAIDDFGAQYFTTSEVWDLMNNGQFSMRFKGFEHKDHRDASGNIDGNTIYFGSRRSSCMLRVYDKKLEQNLKHKKLEEPLIENEWTRWELELKEDRANSAARILEDGAPLGNVVIGILSNYLRFINLDSTRKTLCTSIDKWNAFIAGTLGLSLYQKPEPKTIEDKEAWILKQVAPTLASIVIAHGGDMAFLHEALACGESRMNKGHLVAIRLYQENWESNLHRKLVAY